MDAEHDDLKRLLLRNLELSEETNRIVHGMRRQARWGMIFRMTYWLIVFGLLSASYYFFVAPYAAKFEQIYTSFQSTIGGQAKTTTTQAPSFLQGIGQSFQKYMPLATPPPASTPGQ